MPELPEVETIRLFLQSHLVGKTITDVQILNPKPVMQRLGSFVGDPQKIINTKILSFSRRGKQLSVHLSNKLILLIHLKMTGQLVYLPPLSRSLDPRRGGGPEGGGVSLGHPTPNLNNSKLPNKSTRIVFKLDSPSFLKGGGQGAGFRPKEGFCSLTIPVNSAGSKFFPKMSLPNPKKISV